MAKATGLYEVRTVLKSERRLNRSFATYGDALKYYDELRLNGVMAVIRDEMDDGTASTEVHSVIF